MRASRISLLVAALALWAGHGFAEPSPPSRPSEPSRPSQPSFSADGLYNLANSYARAGKLGLAVLSYERAALLAPDDPDIDANLAYVRASAHLAMKPRSGFARVVQAVSPTLVAWLGVLGVVLVGMGLVASKVALRLSWIPGASVLCGVVLLALSASNAILAWPRMHEAVVLIDQTPARVVPAPMGDTAFVLREADSVTMTAEHEDFILVRNGGGLSGWVTRASLGAVVP